MAALYLIPTTLGDSSIESVIPTEVQNHIREIKHFIVENIRSTRRYLKKVDRSIVIEDLTFYELNKRTDAGMLATFLLPIKKGEDIGIISEAGCPGVADPGADVVRIAHEKGIQVKPLVGPSSILLSLMASGLNGQNFAFVGYIPIKKGERIKQIKLLEARAMKEKQTQIFIEVPYRSQALFTDIIESCRPATRVTVGKNISLETESIETHTAQEWKKKTLELHKELVVFLIGS